MMIREFKERDLEFVQERNFILALQIQYCGDFDRARSFTVIEDAENIFTIPEYRRKHIASELINIAFDKLQKDGKKIATLTVIGDNKSAMQLYQKIGYELMGYIIEVHWDAN